MLTLLRWLGLHLFRWLGAGESTPAERRATVWVAAMFCFALASSFVLRPLREQFGVAQGVARMPYLYGLTLLVTLLFAPAFWWLANRMPSRRFVPITLHTFAASMLVLYFGLGSVGNYDWKAPGHQWFGEAFWGFFNAFNLAVPTLVWIHSVEHFRRGQGLRLFGLIGVGGTLGAMLGSRLATWLAVDWQLPPSASALASLVLLEATWVCYRASLPACAALRIGGDPASIVPSGGVFAGVRLLLHDRRLLGIAGYMLLLSIVATAFSVAQTRLVGEQVQGGRSQLEWLGNLEANIQSIILVLQLLATSRLLKRLPAALFLSLLPIVAMVGIGALSLWPTVVAIALVQMARRVAQLALEKPAREVLYTPFDLETKHKVKFLLDTFMIRLGDWLGACYQVLLVGWGVGVGVVALGTVGLAVLWAVVGIGLGRGSQKRGDPTDAKADAAVAAGRS